MTPTHYSFIPGTCERQVAPNIVFRPIRSWHSGVYAGEGLYEVNGDGSGCLLRGTDRPLRTCYQPLSVTHRIYWDTRTAMTISAFLSYPHAMGACPTYFWEIMAGDIERFDTEAEAEARIIDLLESSYALPPTPTT